MKRNSLLIIMLILILSIYASAENNYSAAYMKLGLGARAISMGGTGTASVNNATAAYWNPAGLDKVKNIQFATMYTAFTENEGFDRNFYSAFLAMNFNYGVVAISWINASVPDIDEFDENNNFTGVFDFSDNNITISYQVPYSNLKFGANAKMYLSKIDDDSENGFGFDAGLIWDINDNMSIASMVRDLVGDYAGDKISPQFNVGAELKPFKGFTFASDVRQEEDLDPVVCFGLEYSTGFGSNEEVKSSLYSIDTDEVVEDDFVSNTHGSIRAGSNDGAFTAGIGLVYRMIETNYAFVSGDDEGLNDTHRISLILHF